MRTYKFRCYDKPSKEMHNFDGMPMFVEDLEIQDDDFVVMQYININDKKGRPIFEDDILKGPSTYPMQVLMDKGHVEVVYKDASEPVIELFFQSEVFQNDLEVIGNIHQHKHLLEVSQ